MNSVIFIGFQPTEDPHFQFRLFNVFGVNGLPDGSTVTIDSLIQHNVMPPDTTIEEAKKEYDEMTVYLSEA